MLAGSRFTHPEESRYAPVEGEALAVVYGLRFTRHFVLGCDNLVVTTDHEPLLGVLNNRNLGDIKERLLSLKEKTLSLRISVIHRPGQKQKAPDGNSTKPIGDTNKQPLDSNVKDSDSSHVLNRVSDFLRPQGRGNTTRQLIWK